MNFAIIPIVLLLISTRISAQTDSASYFFQKGILEKQNGRRMESLKNFEKAKNYDQPVKELISELAFAYLDLRKYHMAFEHFKMLVEMGDGSAATCKQLLVLSFNLKKQNEVILYANKLKKIDPSEKVNYYLGKVNYDMDNYAEAIKYFLETSKEEPQNAEAPYLIALCYADMMNYKQAVTYFLKAIELDKSKSSWIYELGLIYYATHDDKNALKYIIEAGEKGYNKDNDYMENLGIAHLNTGKLEEGVAILAEILKRKPSDLNILNMIAEAYYSKGKFNEAIDYWDQVMLYDKANASALYMVGMSYQKKGEKEKGIALCDKAIEMDPSLTSLKQKKIAMGL